MLLEEGYAVQLQHQEKEEGDGWISILLGGEKLVMSEDVQHNRKWYDREVILEQMGGAVIEKAKLLSGE